MTKTDLQIIELYEQGKINELTDFVKSDKYSYDNVDSLHVRDIMYELRICPICGNKILNTQKYGNEDSYYSGVFYKESYTIFKCVHCEKEVKIF